MSALTLAFVILLSAGTAWGLNAFALMRWRRSTQLHWTERARLLFPARVTRQLNLWLIPCACVLAARQCAPEIPWLVIALISYAAGLLANYPMDRATNPGWHFRPWLHFCTVAVTLQGLPWLVLLAAIFLMPVPMDPTAWVVVGSALAINLALIYGLALRLLRVCRLLTPAPEPLQRLVDETCVKMNVAVRATWVLANPDANAIAFVTTRELAFTDKLLAELSDDELRAVCAHELGHISEGRWIRWVRVAGALMYFPFIFLRPAVQHYGIAGIALLYGAFLVIWLGKGRLARAMETRADRIALTNVEHPSVYAQALEHIYRANQMPVVMPSSRSRPHPDLYDRMLAAHVTPDYPRPLPPTSQAWSSLVLVVVCVVLAVVAL